MAEKYPEGKFEITERDANANWFVRGKTRVRHRRLHQPTDGKPAGGWF